MLGKFFPDAMRAFIDIIPAGIVIFDQEGKVVFSNNEASRIAGGGTIKNIYAHDGGYTIHWPDGSLCTPDELPVIRALKSGCAVKNAELIMRFENGEERIVLVSSNPIMDENNTVEGAIAIFQDITARKNDEQKLIESERTIKSLMDGIKETMLLMDKNGTVLVANRTGAGRLGLTRDKLIGTSIYGHFSPKVAELRKEKIEEVVSSGKPVCFEDYRDGFSFNNDFFPVFDSPGKVSKVAVFSQDITNRKKIEEALRESEERFRSIFENAATGISLTALDGHYLMVNDSLCNIMGYTKEELGNMSFSDATIPCDSDKDSECAQKLIDGRVKNFQMEKRYRHKNGNIIWVLVNVSLVRDSRGNPFYYIGQVQDITLRKKAEEELKRAKNHAEKLASTDYLTGILNRRAFIDRFSEELSRAERDKSSISLILADMDDFKSINDSFGHQVGDLALQKFAKCLSGICRPYDFIGRHGGEGNVDLLIRYADKAMYMAKANGRNKVCVI